jgi:hypothetical protein
LITDYSQDELLTTYAEAAMPNEPTGRRAKKASYKALSNLAVAAEKNAGKKVAETRKTKRNIDKHCRQTLTQNEG